MTTQQTDRTGWLILDEKTYAAEPQHYGAYPMVDAFETVEEMEEALEMLDTIIKIYQGKA